MALIRSPLFICFALSLLALAAALYAEFGLGMAPCILCLAQRLPHVLAVIIIAATTTLRRGRRLALWLLIPTYLLGTGIGLYQVGVEQAWWGVTQTEKSCALSENTAVENIEALYENMSGTAMGDCAQPAFSFYGITFAAMNATLCFMLAGFIFYHVRKND